MNNNRVLKVRIYTHRTDLRGADRKAEDLRIADIFAV